MDAVLNNTVSTSTEHSLNMYYNDINSMESYTSSLYEEVASTFGDLVTSATSYGTLASSLFASGNTTTATTATSMAGTFRNAASSLFTSENATTATTIGSYSSSTTTTGTFNLLIDDTVAIIVVGAVVLILLMIGVLTFCYLRHKISNPMQMSCSRRCYGMLCERCCDNEERIDSTDLPTVQDDGDQDEGNQAMLLDNEEQVASAPNEPTSQETSPLV